MGLEAYSDEQLLEMLKKHAAVEPPVQARPDPKPDPLQIMKDTNLRALGGAVEPNMTLGSGMVAAPLAGLAGIAGSVLPGPEGQGANWTRNVQEAMTYQPMSEGGKDAMKVIGYPFEKIGEFSRWLGGGATDLTGSPAVGAGAETALTAAQMIPLLKYGPNIPKSSPHLATGPRRFVQNLFGDKETRAGALAGDVAGDRRAAVVAALKGHKNTLPGSVATAGQAALPAGSAEFAALQEMVANRAPSKYGTAGIEGVQEGARQAAAESIARTPADLAAALKARTTATAPMREANLVSANVLHGGVKADALIQALDKKLSTPGLRSSDVVQKSLGAVREKIAALGEKTGTVDAKDLYTIRKEAGNTISAFAKETSNWDKRLTSGLQKDVQGIIDSSIESAGGVTWKDYLAKYGKMSEPVNRMETGRIVADALRNSLGTAERPATFATTLKKAAEEQSFATGKARMADLTPAEQGLVEAIKGELARDATLKRMAQEGSQETARRVGASLPVAPGVGVFAPKINVMRALYNRLIGKAEESTLRVLAEKMDNPKEMARIMELAVQPTLPRSQLADQLLKYSTTGAVVPQLQGQEP